MFHKCKTKHLAQNNLVRELCPFGVMDICRLEGHEFWSNPQGWDLQSPGSFSLTLSTFHHTLVDSRAVGLRLMQE